MLALTALAVALALPALGRSSAGDFRLAGASLSQAANDRGEEAFRALLRHAAPAPAEGERAAEESAAIAVGDNRVIEFAAFLDAPSLCTRDIGWVRVRFWIEADATGGVLRCQSPGREDVLARWVGASPGFAFLTGDSGWRSDLGAPLPFRRLERAPLGHRAGDDSRRSSTRAPVLVRFSAPVGAGQEQVWIEAVAAVPAQTTVTPARADDGGGDLDR